MKIQGKMFHYRSFFSNDFRLMLWFDFENGWNYSVVKMVEEPKTSVEKIAAVAAVERRTLLPHAYTTDTRQQQQSLNQVEALMVEDKRIWVNHLLNPVDSLDCCCSLFWLHWKINKYLDCTEDQTRTKIILEFPHERSRAPTIFFETQMVSYVIVNETENTNEVSIKCSFF